MKAYSSYSFNTQTGKYSGAGSSLAVYSKNPLSWSAVTQSDQYPYVVPSSGDFICYSNPRAIFGIDISADDVGWTISGSNLISRWLDQSAGTYESGGFYKQTAVVVPGGNFIGYVTSANSNAYPNGGTSGGYYYGNCDSDLPDPANISYPTEDVKAGQTLTVSITKSNGINAGFPAVSYVYQVKRNGGAWVTISTTTNTSVTYIVPDSTTSLQFRVYAKDDAGFTSTTYVTGAAVTLERLNLWVGVNGKARKGVELYVGVNGKARKVTAAYIGVNGKARRFL